MLRLAPLMLMLILSSQSSFAAPPGTLARMGEISLTEAEVRSLAEALPAESRTLQALENRVRGEIIRRAVVSEAKRQNHHKKPEVAARMEQAADQALATSFMNGIAQPPADFPSEDVLKQAYEANKSALMSPAQFRVNQIYIAGKDAKARKQAADLVIEARRKNSSFAALARKSSQHAASAAKGGDLGWLNENDLAPAFRDALGNMAIGAVSEPVAGSDGWHVLQLVEQKESALLPLDKVRALLTQKLRLRKAAEIERAYLDAMLARTPVLLDNISLEAILKR